MAWEAYLDFMVPWAESKDFDTRLRRITEVGNLVFFEIEEHHIRDGGFTIVNSMNVYEFNDDGKIQHLDVYLQGQLDGIQGSAAMKPTRDPACQPMERSSQALRGRAASRQATTRSLAFLVPTQAPTGQDLDMTMPLCLSSSMRGWSFG
jgi:hypothetical protein